MDGMAILFVTIIIMAGLILFILFAKNGAWATKNPVFITAQSLTLILLYINYTALPSNYIAQKILFAILGVVTIAAFFVKKKNFSTARWMVTATSLSALILLQ